MERQTLRWDKSLVLSSYALDIIVPRTKTNTQSTKIFWIDEIKTVWWERQKHKNDLVKVGINTHLCLQPSYSLSTRGNPDNAAVYISSSAVVVIFMYAIYLWMAMSVGLLIYHFGPDWSTSTALGWIAITFCTHINVPQRSSQSFHLFYETFQHRLDELWFRHSCLSPDGLVCWG